MRPPNEMPEKKPRYRSTFCIHYRAMSDHDTCSAAVSYDSLKPVDHDKCPCFRRSDDSGPRTGCDKMEYPTPEQIAEYEKEIAARVERMVIARTAIVEACGGPWKKGTPGKQGAIKCPCCESGTLQFSRAGYNGHVHAACIA